MRSLSVFRSAFNTVKKRYSLLTITALVMCSGVFVYYFYFLTAREDAIDQRQFRGLNRIESNLRTNLEGYRNLAIGQSKAAVGTLLDKYLMNGGDLDSLGKKLDSLEETYRREFINLSFLGAGRPANGLELIDVDIDTTRGELETELTGNITHSIDSDSLIDIHVEVPLESASHSEVKDLYLAKLEFAIPMGEVIRRLLRYDMFNEYLVLRDGKIVYSTISTGLKEFKPDSSFAAENQNAKIGYADINGKRYRVYEAGFALQSEPGWKIVGLKSEDDFATERRTIPRPYLFAVFLFIVGLVLSVPFIKSMIMSRTERLATTDVVFSSISLAIATSIIAVVLLDGYMRVDLDNVEQDNRLRVLGQLIEHNIEEETRAVTEELSNYAEYFAVREDTITQLSTQKRNDFVQKRAKEYTFRHYDEAKNMFFVDNAGFTTYDYFESYLNFNVGRREYVRGVMNGDCMKMNNVETPLFLDAIFSWREQQFRAVVAIPTQGPDEFSKKYPVTVMTFRMRSLCDPVLAPGTGFCVFNESGNVLFHSDSMRNLDENIFEECANDPVLLAAVTGRTTTPMSVDYAGIPTRMLVSPMNGMPYFVATFSTRAPVDAVHGQVFGMSFIFQVLLFVWFIIVILLGILLMRRKTRLNIPLVSLSGFTPAPVARERYLRAFVFNVMHGLLLFTCGCLLNSPLMVIFMFFISVPYTVLLNMILLSGEDVSAFINGPRYWMFLCNVVMLIGINLTAVYYVNWSGMLILIQLLIVGIYFAVRNINFDPGQKGIRSVADRANYKTAYRLLAYSLMIIVSVVPATRFAIIAYDKEKEIEVKAAQLEIRNELAADKAFVYTDTLDVLSRYYYPFNETALMVDGALSEEPTGDTLPFDRLSAFLRGLIQSSGERYNRLEFGAHDSMWQWNYSPGDTLTMTGKIPGCDQDNESFRITSEIASFRVPLFRLGERAETIRFWLLIILAFVALFQVLRFFVGRIFAHEKYSRMRSLRFDQTFLASARSDYKAFVTGVPSAGKSAYFKTICAGQKNVHAIDFVAMKVDKWKEVLEQALTGGSGTIVLDHFEHDVLDPVKCKEKLEIVERLVASRSLKVIIISAIQPAVFLNLVDKTEQAEGANADAQRMGERWSRALAAFYDFTYPLQGYDKVPSRLETLFRKTIDGAEPQLPRELIALTEAECDHGVFMRSIGVELLAELHGRVDIQVRMNPKAMWVEREDLIIRTQKLAENYYRSIWNNLAVEEQFVLYDLAQDGLVNAKNLDIVEVLIDKGLVIYTQQLEIMNHSFRNFILCVVGPADIGKLEDSMRHAGNWSKLKAPLFLIVFALLLFVIKSDRSALFGYFTAFTAIIPLVVAVFSLFGKVGTKKE